MNKFGIQTTPPQNFAVSSARLLRVRAREREASLLPVELDRLENEVTRAWAHWRALFSAPDVWTNPRARRAMCAARLSYQDAQFALADACAAVRSQETGPSDSGIRR